MTTGDRLHPWSPVVKAGLSFLLFAAVLLPLGHLLRSSVIAGLGSEMTFDGCFYLFGGGLSQALKRSRFHWLNCRTREGLEITALIAGTVVFAVGALIQPSTRTGVDQIAVGVVFAPIAIWLYRYWHARTEEGEDHHHGFSWHLLADMIAAGSIAPVALIAYLTKEPAWNFYGAMVVFAIILVLAIKPAWQIRLRLRDHTLYHPPPG